MGQKGGVGISPPLACPGAEIGWVGLRVDARYNPKGRSLTLPPVEVQGHLSPGEIHWKVFLTLVPVEVLGRLPPGAIHRKGRVWNVPPPRPNFFTGFPAMVGFVARL